MKSDRRLDDARKYRVSLPRKYIINTRALPSMKTQADVTFHSKPKTKVKIIILRSSLLPSSLGRLELLRKILGAILLPPRPRVFSLSADLRDASSTNVFFSSLAAHQHDPRLHSTPCCFSSRYRGGKAIFRAASGQRKYPRFFKANDKLKSRLARPLGKSGDAIIYKNVSRSVRKIWKHAQDEDKEGEKEVDKNRQILDGTRNGYKINEFVVKNGS